MTGGRTAAKSFRSRLILVAVVFVGTAAAGVLGVSASAQTSNATVSFRDWELSCPKTVSEGEAASCTLTNNRVGARRDWPVVALLHLSSDDDRALVHGEPVDVAWGTGSPSSRLDDGVWWIGPELVAYSRFQWLGTKANQRQSRTVSFSVVDDIDYEDPERFYIALGPHMSKQVGFLHTSRQPITIARSDTKSADTALRGLRASARGTDLTLTTAGDVYSATVPYEDSEVTVTPTAAHKRATITVDGVPVPSGEESVAVPLAAGGATSVLTRVTAENGDEKIYTVSITRSANPAGSGGTVTVVEGSFTLSCPATAKEQTPYACTLTNTGTEAAGWPVVAIMHSSADENRALVEEDSAAAGTEFGRDAALASPQVPPVEAFNYGYGELFSGGSTTVYTVYGYQKFDWTGQAAAGAEREVAVVIAADGRYEPSEVFYVALAPSGHGGLSRLAENRAPVWITP